MNALGLLAAGRRVNLDIAIERRVGVLKPQIALPAAKEREKDLAEVLAYL